MKNLIFLVLILSFSSSIEAQNRVRIGFVDMDRILENLNEYKDSDKALDDKIKFWKKEIENKQTKIDGLQKQLFIERPLLTKELIEEREEDIAFELDELNSYKEKRLAHKEIGWPKNNLPTNT